MRVLHVIPSVARRDGGPSEIVHPLIDGLNRLPNVDALLVTTDKGLDVSERRDLSRAVVTRARRPNRWTFSPALVGKLRQLIPAVDVVHVHSVHTFPTTAALRLAATAGVPAVVQPHGALDDYHLSQRRLLKQAYLRWVDGRGLASARSFIVSSDRERVGVEPLRRPGQDVWELSLGVDSKLFETPRDPTFADPFVLFLGRVTEKKQLDRLILALSRDPLRESTLKLVVAGPIDPRLGWDPVTLVSEAGLSDRVLFMGTVGPNERRRLLSRAVAFVLPSRDESFGVAVAEALAAACPVIATQAVGIAPAAAHAGALWLSSDTPDGLARTVGALVAMPDMGAHVGVRARQYAQARFSWHAVVQQLADQYQGLTA